VYDLETLPADRCLKAAFFILTSALAINDVVAVCIGWRFRDSVWYMYRMRVMVIIFSGTWVKIAFFAYLSSKEKIISLFRRCRNIAIFI